MSPRISRRNGWVIKEELTDDQRRERRCRNKIQYDVWIDAFEWCVDVYEREDRANSSVLTVYHCDYCGFYHVGHAIGTWRKRNVAKQRLEKARRKRVARRAERERASATWRRGGADQQSAG